MNKPTKSKNNDHSSSVSIWRSLFLPVFLILAISLIYFFLVMRPPVSDLGLMLLLLSMTAAISALAGYAVYRLGWMEHSPALRWTLLGGYILSGILTFFNVWVTAQLMFADQHDLLLSSVLLLFATGIAITIGYFFSNTIIERLSKLQSAANQIAKGNFEVRTSVSGRDELASLAQSIDDMTRQLHLADHKKQELDSLRRDLIAWISHDLQTPLTSIRAMVEALVDGMVEDSPTHDRYLKNIQLETESLSKLIDDLFQIAQIDAVGLNLIKEENSITRLTEQVIELFEELAIRKKIKLSLESSGEIQTFRFDKKMIERVLNNLISNAIRHTPADGQISVSVKQNQDNVLIQVSDTGQGISPKDLPFIFERFYRGEKSRSRQTGGTGLGLTIAREIISAHGGTLTVENNIEKGARFIITLPYKGN